MVQYYYNRYNAIPSTKWVEQAGWGFEQIIDMHFNGKSKSYSFDAVNNLFVLGTDMWGSNDSIKIDDICYLKYETMLYKFVARTDTVSGVASPTNRSYKMEQGSTQETTYSPGALIQSNIKAEDGTYPAYGRHTDEYWYVKGAAVNTAPTQPGAFTQPLGMLETGDSKVFSVGAASDAESNLSKYIWEVSINGAAYSKAGETTSPSFTYTIPTATSLRMRVKAVDTAGLESVYRESSSYTVQPPQYYYEKFTAIGTPIYTWGVEFGSETSDFGGQTATGNTSYSVDSTGKITLTGSVMTIGGGSVQTNGTVYYLSGSWLYKYVASGQWYIMDEYIGVAKQINNGTSYSRGSLIQSGIKAGASTYPSNGQYTDGYWYVRGSRVSQSIAPPSLFTAPAQGKKFKPNEVASIVFGASTAPSLSLYEVDYRYNSTGAWTPLAYNNTLTRSFTITIDKTLKTLELRVRAKNTSNVYSDYVYSEPFIIEHNVASTVSLTGPSDNATLYETDTLNIKGTAHDADADQSVTVFYQINSEQRKVLATNISQTQIALSKQLTFKGGKLYDGDTALTVTLADGVAHTLKVWAEDSEKASSAIVERTFYVVPNRAPLLSVDAVVPSGVVDADKFKISGTASDQDANSMVKVTRRINTGNAVEIYSGAGGAWEFELALSQLVVGQNTIVIEVVDNYGAKASKTVTLNKKEVKTPILQSVARYTIEPPKGSAKGVLLFIQRDEELDVKVELSMTLSGEQEQYETLTPVNTAPVQQGVVEDTFEHEVLEAKQNIILKITPSRTDLSFNHKIHLISGAVD